MSEIIIEPVTRIEGHAKISVFLDEAGQVTNAHFHVTQVRGFERIAQGRPMYEGIACHQIHRMPAHHCETTHPRRC